MNDPRVTPNAEIDTSPRAMAARFGARARLNIQRGENPREAARLAASYAFMAEPALRGWRVGTELNRTAVDRLVH